jgi:hypothetical protein
MSPSFLTTIAIVPHFSRATISAGITVANTQEFLAKWCEVNPTERSLQHVSSSSLANRLLLACTRASAATVFSAPPLIATPQAARICNLVCNGAYNRTCNRARVSLVPSGTSSNGCPRGLSSLKLPDCC